MDDGPGSSCGMIIAAIVGLAIVVAALYLLLWPAVRGVMEGLG